MSIALLDFLLDRIEVNFLPSFECAIIICNENCKACEPIFRSFSLTSSIEVLKNGGCFMVKVKNEVQRGFLINYLNKALKPKVFSHRPETLAKILSQQDILPLVTPERIVSRPLKNVEKNGKILDTILEPKENPIKAQDLFAKIYQESFEKYVKIILTTANKAEKTKSFKAQIKNIVEGIIVSNQKKSGFLINFSADKITESIISDLESNEIIRFGSNNIIYCDLLIEQFFGNNKTKVFITGFNVTGDVEIKNQKKSQNKVNLLEKDWENNVYEYCVQNSDILKSKTVGELTYEINLGINHCCKKDFDWSVVYEIEVFDKVLKKLISEFFMVEKVSVDEIMKDVHKNFAVKLSKKTN